MNKVIEWLSSVDLINIGIQKNLLLSALIGNLLNMPRNVKSKIQKTILVLLSTIMSTIMTPFILELLSTLGLKITTGSSFAVAGLVGIVGISTLKKYIVDKLNNNVNPGKNEPTSNN
jgi:hypothetical protein